MILINFFVGCDQIDAIVTRGHESTSYNQCWLVLVYFFLLTALYQRKFLFYSTGMAPHGSWTFIFKKGQNRSFSNSSFLMFEWIFDSSDR